MNKIRFTELLPFENIDKSYLYSRVTQDTNFISQSALIIINVCQSFSIIVFCLIYIAWLSKMAFVITLVTILAAVLIYLSYRKETDRLLRESTKKDTELFGCLSHILDGFKEIKLNKQKNDDLFNHYKEIADSTEEIKVKTGIKFASDMIFSQVVFYVLIATIVFLLPVLINTYASVVIKTVMVSLFLIGPLEFVVGSISIIARANMAVDNLYELENRLDNVSDSDAEYDLKDQLDFSREISLENITFSYVDTLGKALFTLGPISLSIKRGEILFIVGGNGSGKSTLLKLLTGLYYPTQGDIILNDEVITRPVFPAYRELFSAVFADFHLFDRFYGLTDIDEKKINKWIKTMELKRKTKYKDGKFSDINLSTGQRKRLALIVAFLDDRPLYVFDEVAADQDPQFRKYFYEVLLSDLKKQGKTIITATHDDRYFHVADRVLKLDYGKLQNS